MVSCFVLFRFSSFVARASVAQAGPKLVMETINFRFPCLCSPSTAAGVHAELRLELQPSWMLGKYSTY